MFCSGLKVVEAVLFIEEPSPVVPVLAIFTASTNIGDGIVTKVLNVKDLGDGEAGREKKLQK